MKSNKEKVFFYNKINNEDIIFSFDNCSCLEFIKLLPIDLKLKIVNFSGSKLFNEEIYIGVEEVNHINSIEKMKEFLQTNINLLIDDIDFILQDAIEVSIHDDYEVNLTFSLTSLKIKYDSFIESILRKIGYKSIAFDYLKQNIGKYVLIEKEAQIKKVYDSFDDYIDDIRKK
ncbi:hypothetical protein [Orenia marismortui]|uniref:Uncharacterized protein n=1 Tax=Orenia marismortui TaxID=46469 RepID=A0A4R8GY39_9FIRM|nr:hypothetical protein [Orenia marismortui]TDX51142.1 hypothetical protein C7959_11518 [Orenia marismortui]